MADLDVRQQTVGLEQESSAELTNEGANTLDFGSNTQNSANAPPVDPVDGSALTADLASRVNELLETTQISVNAWEAVAGAVPAGLAAAARYAAESAGLTARMVEEDAATLADTDPSEGGALAAQLEAGCDELADVANVVESYACLAEVRTEYEVTAFVMQGLLLAGAANGIGPELKHAAEVTDRLDTLRERAFQMLKDAAKAIVEEAVNKAADQLIQRLAFIAAASAFGPTPMGLLTMELGVFYGGMGKDFLLGRVFGEGSPESVAAAAVSTASSTRDAVDKADGVARGFARLDRTVSGEALEASNTFLSQAGDTVESTEQVLELVSVVREFVGAIQEARGAKADLEAAMTALAPMLQIARTAMHETLVGLAEKVADAATDVDRFESEWRGR